MYVVTIYVPSVHTCNMFNFEEYLLTGQTDVYVGLTAIFFLKSKSRKIFIFGVTTSTTLELKFHNLSIEIGRLSYKWQ